MQQCRKAVRDRMSSPNQGYFQRAVNMGQTQYIKSSASWTPAAKQAYFKIICFTESNLQIQRTNCWLPGGVEVEKGHNGGKEVGDPGFQC